MPSAVVCFIFLQRLATMNSIERKRKDADRKRKARLLESDEQKRSRLQANMLMELANTGTIYIIMYFLLQVAGGVIFITSIWRSGIRQIFHLFIYYHVFLSNL